MRDVNECMKNIPKCLKEKDQVETLKNIDSKLSELELKINENNISDNYEKQENGKFHLKLNGEELNLDLDKKYLVSALKLTYEIINLYRKDKHNGEKFYSEESEGSKGDIDRSAIIDMKIDNRPIFDTTFLSEEGFIKNFGINPSRSNGIMGEYIQFLNNILGVNK